METITLKLKKSDVEKIENTIDAVVAKFVENLPAVINKKLEDIVFQTLGFSNRWGEKVEIDHCNGREPLVAQYINEKTKKDCAEIISKFNFKFSKDLEKALADEYAEKLQKRLGWDLDQQVANHFSDLIGKLVDTGEIKFEQVIMAPKIKDATNPDHMSKTPKIRDLVYRDLVAKDSNAKTE